MSHVAQVEPHVVNGGARTTLLFGAVRFELMADFPLPALSREDDVFVERDPHGLVLAEVSVSLHGVDSSDPKRRAPLIAWRDDRASNTAPRVFVEVAQLGRARFVARASVARDAEGLGTLLTYLTGAVVERLGGVCLHAAVVALGERGVVFIGPSGAGKSTAVDLCEGGSWLAKDRAAVVPHEDGFVTFGVPGGSPCSLPRAEGAVRRLAGIARVRRERDVVTLERLEGVAALCALRENTTSGGDENAEQRRLDALVHLVEHAPVADLHTRLGVSLTQLMLSEFP